MKMTKAHYEILKQKIEEQMQRDPKMYENYMELGYTHRRYNWDLLWRAKLNKFVCDTLYQYLNDDHINTALQHITGKFDE